MDIQSFYKKKDHICFQKRNMTFQIHPSENKDTIHLRITCDKKGFFPIFFGYILASFLKKNFFQIHATRLQYIFSQKKELVIYKQIERKEYQYFLSEIMTCLCLILGVIWFYLNLSFVANICFFIGLIINIYGVFFALYKTLDYVSSVSSQRKYTDVDMKRLVTNLGLSFLLFPFSLMFLRLLH